MVLAVCFVATELFSWGKYGGFGMCTRTLGAELARRGLNVSAVVPRGHGQKPEEVLDGIEVVSYPLHGYPFTKSLYRGCDADVYHSEEPSWGSIIARKAMHDRRHIVTCQNPRTRYDWSRVDRYYPLRRRAFNRVFEGALKEIVGLMDAVYCQAKYIIPKVRALYGLSEDPAFLPNPVKIPIKNAVKAGDPTVCFLGRFDPEKRPELFFELAKMLPDINFIAMGRAHNNAKDRWLRRVYGKMKNLEMPGFLTGEDKNGVLARSWILVNTSVSECLPVSFLEAAANNCAILSFNDPDGFASRFGHHAVEGDLEGGLRLLLEGDRWKELGESGYSYVSEVHELGRVVQLHIDIYEKLCGR